MAARMGWIGPGLEVVHSPQSHPLNLTELNSTDTIATELDCF